MCVHIKRYYVIGSKKGDIDQIRRKVQNMENDFFGENVGRYSRNPPFSYTFDSIDIEILDFHPLPPRAWVFFKL